MSGLWIPGMAAGPQEDFVHRLVRRIEAFAERRGWEQAVVELELVDGAALTLHSISPEPGFGFITVCPYPEDAEKPWPKAGSADEPVPPEEVIIPVGSIRRITLGEAEERSRFGFARPADSGGER